MNFWLCRGNGLKDTIKFEIYDFITLTNNYNTNIVQYAQGIQVPLQSCSWISGTLQYILPCQLVWIFTLSGSFIGIDEDSCQDSQQWSTWTERPISRLHLRMDFFGLFLTDKCSCTQFPDRPRCFCLLAELVHWSCSSKFMCPLMNFVYQGMVVKVELTAKFCL